MTNPKSISQTIATILRAIGSEKALQKAASLALSATSMNTLHLRDLELTPAAVTTIVNALKQAGEENNLPIQAISFSYNSQIGDEAAIALASHLPPSIREIGLVNCGISDTGGRAILEWMNRSPQLRMICMEENHFSAKLRQKLQAFSHINPQILVVY